MKSLLWILMTVVSHQQAWAHTARLQRLQNSLLTNGQTLASQQLESAELCIEDSSPLGELATTMLAASEVIGCRDLQPGQSKLFSAENAFPSVVQVGSQRIKVANESGNYLLRRHPDGKYEAVLGVNFLASKFAPAGATSGELLKKAQTCMADIAPGLRGPGGEQLEISILGPTQVGLLPKPQRPAVQNISIVSPDLRANAIQYPSSINCAVIAHEVMHMFGLVDEYAESDPTLGYQCRVLPATPSVMSDPATAVTLAIPRDLSCTCVNSICRSIIDSDDEKLKTFYLRSHNRDLIGLEAQSSSCENITLPKLDYSQLSDPDKRAVVVKNDPLEAAVELRFIDIDFPKVERVLITCKCGPGDQACVSNKDRFLARASLPRMSDCPEQSEKTKPSLYSQKPPFGKLEKLGDGNFTFRTEKSLSTLLLPAHFRKILGGTCGAKSARYNHCAQFAYKTKPCPPRPVECYQDSYFLGTTK